MRAFRSEIRNSPREQTIKVFLKDVVYNKNIKSYLKRVKGVKFIEIRDSIERNRISQHLTIYKQEEVNINELHDTLIRSLFIYFQPIL
ncbi:MAG: hypothetical protein HRT67_07130 [Flavobacteriaceae bacterium]|nr:hypothetical protein [Flavobacteriaceae bacterium]